MLRPSRVLGLALCLAVALAATALAALPSTKHKLIVPGTSLGGVKLGGTYAAGATAWGKGSCNTSSTFTVCSYSGTSSSDGNASFYGKPKGKISGIQIAAGYAGSDPNYNTSLAKFKTKKGIKIGSSDGAVKSAYPKAKKHRIPGASNYERVLTGPGKHVTRFQMSSAPVRVLAIIITSGG